MTTLDPWQRPEGPHRTDIPTDDLPAGARRGWLLTFPYTTNPIPINGSRGGHHAHARKVRDVRAAAYYLATSHPAMPRCERIRVELTWYVNTDRRRDAVNLALVLKAMQDALTDGDGRYLGAGVVSDDTPDLMESALPRIRFDRSTIPRMVLTVLDLTQPNKEN